MCVDSMLNRFLNLHKINVFFFRDTLWYCCLCCTFIFFNMTHAQSFPLEIFYQTRCLFCFDATLRNVKQLKNGNSNRSKKREKANFENILQGKYKLSPLSFFVIQFILVYPTRKTLIQMRLVLKERWEMWNVWMSENVLICAVFWDLFFVSFFFVVVER